MPLAPGCAGRRGSRGDRLGLHRCLSVISMPALLRRGSAAPRPRSPSVPPSPRGAAGGAARGRLSRSRQRVALPSHRRGAEGAARERSGKRTGSGEGTEPGTHRERRGNGAGNAPGAERERSGSRVWRGGPVVGGGRLRRSGSMYQYSTYLP
ncbi:uncharacterized protein GJ701_000260 isoform 1-T6 [Geothlypis trichas]